MNTKATKIRLAAYTDPAGKWNEDAPNKGNEDNMFIDADLMDEKPGAFVPDEEIDLQGYGCLLVVADGMGGMNAGEVASAIAIDVVKQRFSPDSLSDSIASSAASRAEYMESVVMAADEAIKKEAKNDPACEGMGSTIIMAWLYGGEVTVTWCGDSRAYLFRPSSGLCQISKDHSYVQQLVDDGKITMDEAFDHPYNNIITRSLGDPEKKAKADSRTVEVYEGDIVLVCSDGLSGALRDNEIETIISGNKETLSGCRKALWEAAEPNWYDNVTAILCEVTSGVVVPAGKQDMDRSFISLKLSKRGVKFAAGILVAVAAAVGIWFGGRSLVGDRTAFRELRDSLAVKASDAGLAFLSDSLKSLSLKDTLALQKWENVLMQRLDFLSRIDSMKCPDECVAIKQLISRLRQDVLAPDNNAEETSRMLSDVSGSLKNMKNILSDIDKVLKGNMDTALKNKVKLFRHELALKEKVGREELIDWGKLKKNILRAKKGRAGSYDYSDSVPSVSDTLFPSVPDTASHRKLVPISEK